jgi:SulP family sulfate permease
MVMTRAGFIDRLGQQNVCPHIDAALARAREILGLPPAPAADPHYQERLRLEAVRLELANALDRVNTVLKTPAPASTQASPPQADKISVQVE